MANDWPNLVPGIKNILAALTGQLAYSDLKRNKTVGIAKSGTVIFTRARGLHLSQAGILNDELMSASLFDVAMVAFQSDPDRLAHPLSFYIPKSESAEEALWWRDLFQPIEAPKGLPPGSINGMPPLKSHPIPSHTEKFI